MMQCIKMVNDDTSLSSLGYERLVNCNKICGVPVTLCKKLRWRHLFDGIIQPPMAIVYRHLLLFVIILQLISSVVAFSSSSSNINNQPTTLPHKNIKNYNTVHISKVQTNADILSLPNYDIKNG